MSLHSCKFWSGLLVLFTASQLSVSAPMCFKCFEFFIGSVGWFSSGASDQSRLILRGLVRAVFMLSRFLLVNRMDRHRADPFLSVSEVFFFVVRRVKSDQSRFILKPFGMQHAAEVFMRSSWLLRAVFDTVTGSSSRGSNGIFVAPRCDGSSSFSSDFIGLIGMEPIPSLSPSCRRRLHCRSIVG